MDNNNITFNFDREIFNRNKLISMVKFVREEGNTGIVEAKELVEWFMAECPVKIKEWEKIRLLARLAKMLGNHTLVVQNGMGYCVRTIGETELYERFNLRVTGNIVPVKIEERIPYEFPEDFI